MKPIPGTLQEGGAGFQTTHWTLVLRARQTQSDISSNGSRDDPMASSYHASGDSSDLSLVRLIKSRSLAALT